METKANAVKNTNTRKTREEWKQSNQKKPLQQLYWMLKVASLYNISKIQSKIIHYFVAEILSECWDKDIFGHLELFLKL